MLAEDFNIDPELLKKFSLVEENGQTVVEVSMASLLSLALERATTMDIIAIDKKIASETLEAVQDVYNPVFKTSMAMMRETTPSGTNMSGDVPSMTPTLTGHTYSTAPFVSLTNSDISSVSMSLAKMTKAGIKYSLEYQKSSSQTSLGQITAEDDPFGGWTPADDPIYLDSMTLSVQVPLFQDWGDVN
ncbi:hypothetical protein KKA14_02515, partial [bacterium]|nr:hypothetical protein [bacterium]